MSLPIPVHVLDAPLPRLGLQLALLRSLCVVGLSGCGKGSDLSRTPHHARRSRQKTECYHRRSTEHKVQGQPAIEFTLSFFIDGTNLVSHSRYVRFPECIYQQIVTVPAGTSMESDVRRFWEWFQVETK